MLTTGVRQRASEGPVSCTAEPLPFSQGRERGALEVPSQPPSWRICPRRQYRHRTETKGELHGWGRE